MAAIVEKWRQLRREMGAFWAVIYGLHKVGKKFGLNISAYRFAFQPVPEKRLLKKPDNIEFRWLETFVPEMLVEDRKAAWVQARLARGDRCLAAYKEGELIAFLWLAGKHYPEDDARCDYRLEAETLVWDYDVYVAPRYRVTRLFAQLWDEANEALYQQGVRWSVSRISAFNVASIHSHRRRGAVLRGAAIFINAGRWQVLVANRRPFFHVSRQSRPAFRFFAPNAA